ncbi:hypothetical protein CYMTET_25558 [Cymbomonas tetramitiformis]|uniref:Serine aminopeptidase S33 domain-containing protein n=1 Tax=Cymbomonas tetramitiformis TaxID=36881 RepID=A0AAE0KYX6_9CHLO|nr:hypothetical protein CYMTET_25558 [Cymbomonas tetramitiformis]
MISGPTGNLEADVTCTGRTTENLLTGVILLHPHPHMGGSKNDALITGLMQKLGLMKGYVVCRFNYRGVGQSEGVSHANIDEECEDLQAVCKYLFDKEGVRRIVLVGYSFGAMVAASGARAADSAIVGYVMISLPWRMLPERFQINDTLPKLLIIGGKDTISLTHGGVAAYKQYVDKLQNADSQIFPNADHFWRGEESNDIMTAVVNWLCASKM